MNPRLAMGVTLSLLSLIGCGRPTARSAPGDVQTARGSASPTLPQFETWIDRSANPQCTAAIPVSAMARVTVYVTIDATRDSATTWATPSARSLAGRVGARVRTMLGARDDQLPSGDPHVTWQGAGGSLAVTVHRDGRIRWLEPPRDSLHLSGIRLFASALQAVVDSGGTFAWPADAVQDSLVFTMRLHTPLFDRSGAIAATPPAWFAPLFHVMHPWFEPVTVLMLAFPRIPRDAISDGARGRAIFTFVVDTAGRVDPLTVVELQEPEHQRPHGKYDIKYRPHFAKAVREYLLTARYGPALLGGCPIPQAVQQAFQF